MEHQTSTTLFQTGRRVTRYQCKLARRILPFLELPPELRNMIYGLVLDYCGVENYFDKLHDHLMSKREHRQRKPRPSKRTSTLLLLDKQISAEAFHLLLKRGVVFHHGLLTSETVGEIMTPQLLRRISSIQITDDGHPIIKGRILPESWNGYMRLIRELGNLLAEGHRLQSLTIKFGDERLQEHMTECVATGQDCGFRDQMRDAINSLSRVHNVKKVTIIGIIPEQAREMQHRMQRPAFGFADLPRELRDMIYDSAIEWPNIFESLVRGMANWTDQERPFPYPGRSTPTALLLNRQYFTEALEVLRKKPLNIIFPGDHNIVEQDKVPSMMRLISRHALKNAKIIDIRMGSWKWVFNIDKPFTTALATSPHLKQFRLDYKDSLKHSFLKASGQYYPDNKLHLCLMELKRIRGLQLATFEGDLPICYTDALAKIMTSRRHTREQLPELKAINKRGEMVIIDDSAEDDSRHQPVSTTPYLPEANTLN